MIAPNIIEKVVLRSDEIQSAEFNFFSPLITAKGSSTISRIYHGLRGYSNLQLKLRKLGIKVKMKT